MGNLLGNHLPDVDVQLCRRLNPPSEAAASEISAQFRPGIQALLGQHAEARRWTS